MLDRPHTIAEAHATGADTSNDAAQPRRHAFLACIAWLTFIVYGSLLPFEIRDYSLAKGVEIFRNIPYRSLGTLSRADWVANILLYMPLGFLGCAWMAAGARTGVGRILAVSVVFMLCITIAVIIEFVQIFFAPRTVSLNDLLAESIGTLGGVLTWMIWRRRLHGLAQAFLSGGRESLIAATTLYLLAYVALSLFPFDFLVSADEFARKLSSDRLGWFVAGQCEGWVRCVAPRVGEVLGIAPLGVLAAITARQRLSPIRLFLAGAALGVLLEVLQIAIASGLSQGLSVPLRGAGLLAGAWLGQSLRVLGPHAIAGAAWRTARFAAVPWVAAIAAVNGWFKAPWIATDAALERLAEVRLLPFYYHYFSSEVGAMQSLLAQVAMYAPIGFAIWARHAAAAAHRRRSWPTAALLAAAIALPIEFGKLWGPPRAHPDFTSVILAAASATIVYAMTHWLELILTGARSSAAGRIDAPPVPARSPRPALPPIRTMFASIIALTAIVAGLVSYPVATPVLATGLLLYGAWLYQHPPAWLLFVPATLALLDLSPVTGQLLIDEFDLLILGTLAIGYWQTASATPRRYPSALYPIALVLLWCTWCVAMARGLWPLLSAPALAITASSHSPLEAWQVGKGLLWALLLVPLLRRVPERHLAHARHLLLRGLAGALVILSLVIAWQRHVFVGITDFDTVLRVTGTFASMRTGGHHLEAFIAFAFPALAAWTMLQRHWRTRLLGIAGGAAAAYAMLVTFSRVGLAALAVGIAVLLLGSVYQRVRFKRQGLIALAGILVVVIAVAVPVLSSGFAQHRAASASDDLSVRLSHWQRALALMDDAVLTRVFGMGFGRYPTMYLVAADWQRAPGTFTIGRAHKNAYLRLGAGEPVYLEQPVAIERGARYTLSARVRSSDAAAVLRVAICEKSLLYSIACVWHRLEGSATSADWARASVTVDAVTIGATGTWPHRPLRLSLINGTADSVIDVDDVSLTHGDGRELLSNGNFESGAARWLLVSDQAQAWHIDQQLVETYFAQGLLGLLALGVLLLAFGRAALRAIRDDSVYAIAITAGTASFLTVGLLGSVADAPRVSMLLYLGLFAGGLLLPDRRDRGRTGASPAPVETARSRCR